MKKTRTYAAKLAAAEATLRMVLADLADAVRDLPDNPRVTRHDGNAFTVSQNDLGTNWIAGYHDFRHQYRAVARALTAGNVATVASRLRRIIADGRLPSDGGRFLHPDVVTHLKTLLRG